MSATCKISTRTITRFTLQTSESTFTTGGRSGPPLHGISVIRDLSDVQTSLAARGGVECRAGGTGAESGASHQMVAPAFTGDFGKHARHPPGKRKVMGNHGRAQRPSPTRNCVFRYPAIFHASLEARSGVECRAGGTGAESGVSHRMVATVFTGDFGTNARHPPRKRKVMRNRGRAQRPSPTRNCVFRNSGFWAGTAACRKIRLTFSLPEHASHSPKTVAMSPLSDYQ